MVFEEGDPRLSCNGREEGPLDLLPGQIRGVENPPLAVSGLAAKGNPATLPAEPHAPVH